MMLLHYFLYRIQEVPLQLQAYIFNLTLHKRSVEYDFSCFGYFFWNVKQKESIFFCLVSFLPQKKIVNVKLVLVMVRRVFFQLIPPRLVIQDYEFLSLHKNIVHRPPQNISTLILVSNPLEVASPYSKQFVVIKQFHALALSVLPQLWRQFPSLHELVEMRFEYRIHP